MRRGSNRSETDPRRRTHRGPARTGTLDAGSVFRLETTVPTVLARRDASMGPVSPAPVTAGDYVITLDITDTRIPVRIQRDAPATNTRGGGTGDGGGAGAPANCSAPVGSPASRWAPTTGPPRPLGKIFGAPLETTDWADACVDGVLHGSIGRT